MQQPVSSTGAHRPLKVLKVDASGRYEGSVSRALGDEVVDQLWRDQYEVEITHRDLAANPPSFVNEDWIGANFTRETDRDAGQRQTLEGSDELVSELQGADVVIISTPIYNFGVPAALKAWVDMVARAGLTFHYTESGPRGLLEGKRAIVVLTSGGTEVGSAADFASPYLRHVLGFIGITDVEVIAADRLVRNADESTAIARSAIAAIRVPAPAVPTSVLAG